MVLQHANVIRVVILGKKGVGKSGMFSSYFNFNASSTSKSCVLVRTTCKSPMCCLALTFWFALELINYAK